MSGAFIEVPVTGIILQIIEGRIYFQPGDFRASIPQGCFKPVKGGIKVPDCTVVPAGEKSRASDCMGITFQDQLIYDRLSLLSCPGLPVC